MRLSKMCLAVGLAAACATATRAQTKPLVGEPAPRIVRPDLSGKRIDLSGFRGKIVLLNFWASWCAPCLVELPKFASWQERYGTEGLQVIGVSMDDDSGPAAKTVRKLRLNFPVVMGDEKLGMDFGGVLGLPMTFLIGRDGKIMARYGGETDLGKLEGDVQRLLRN